MDLKTLDTVAGAEAGFELQLFHPSTTANLGIFITVLGRDSATYRNLQNKHNRDRVAKAQKLGTTKFNLTLEDIEREVTELLAACTQSWRTVDGDKPAEPVVMLGGERLECNRANATRLYTELPWVKEQVDSAVTDRANFLAR